MDGPGPARDRGGPAGAVENHAERLRTPEGVAVRQETATPSGVFSAGQLTRPYQTLLVQIFCNRTTSPVFGACQIFPFPA